MRIRKYRGLGLRFYLLVSAFGIGSTFYTFRPVIQELEKRSALDERAQAQSAIEAAKKNSLAMKRPLKLSLYHNAGKPRRVLRDDGSDYFSEPNLTPSESLGKQQLKRLERLERLQLGGQSAKKKQVK